MKLRSSTIGVATVDKPDLAGALRALVNAPGDHPLSRVFAYDPAVDEIVRLEADHGFLDPVVGEPEMKKWVVGMLVGSPKFIADSVKPGEGIVAFNLEGHNNDSVEDVVKAAQYLARHVNSVKQVSLQFRSPVHNQDFKQRFEGKIPETLGELAFGLPP